MPTVRRAPGLPVLALMLAALAGACSKSESPPAPAGSYLKVDAYCSAFCTKLCGTCGDASCADACKPRCSHGRGPDMPMDGKDPKVALALGQKELDACLATITAESCPKIMAGEVPSACFTMQH